MPKQKMEKFNWKDAPIHHPTRRGRIRSKVLAQRPLLVGDPTVGTYSCVDAGRTASYTETRKDDWTE
jgi:hypothetical protein